MCWGKPYALTMKAKSQTQLTMKASIPRDLYMVIVKLQADEDLDWDEACSKVAKVVNPKMEEYEEAVKEKALSLAKGEFMTRLNKAREEIQRQARIEARKMGQNFEVPCKRCGKPVKFSAEDKNWDSKVKPLLNQAFSGWVHVNCPT